MLLVRDCGSLRLSHQDWPEGLSASPLRSGAACLCARATGLDHSEEMVGLARERSPGSEVVLARAESLPFAEDTFTAIAMSVVVFFLDDPEVVLHECHRVLRPRGRLATYTTGPELRGTPAAPEPIASRGHFYNDEELDALGRAAGFREVVVHKQRRRPAPGRPVVEPQGAVRATSLVAAFEPRSDTRHTRALPQPRNRRHVDPGSG